MNTRVAIVAALILLCEYSSHGQTLDSALTYYPMTTGNLWQFRCQVRIWPGPYTSLYYYTLEIEGDTLMPNGKVYNIQAEHRDGTLSYSYLRTDSTKANIVQYSPGSVTGEVVVDSLRARPGDSFGAYGCITIFPDTVLGIPTTAKTFVSSSSGTQETLSMGLGPVGFVDLFGDEGNYLSDLVYAKINGVEHGVLASALVGGVGVSRCITLLQNYPNPFNPSTTISYALPQRSHVTLTVFNTLGQQIANVVNGVEEPGEHSVRFDGSGLTSGVYFYQMRAGGYMATKRLLLLR